MWTVFQPNLGCSDERNDAIAAYTHPLRWYLIGDSRYTQRAVQIMEVWSVITDHTNSNARLQPGGRRILDPRRRADPARFTTASTVGCVRPAGRVNRTTDRTALADRVSGRACGITAGAGSWWWCRVCRLMRFVVGVG